MTAVKGSNILYPQMPTLPPSSFQTQNLHIRAVESKDARGIFDAYAQDPEVTRYLIWKPHTSLRTVRAFIADCKENWHSSREFSYVLCARGTDSPIGMISMRLEGFKSSFGYVLARPYWGRGWMPQALTAMLDWALAQPGIFRVWAFCDVENEASLRVMLKTGMQCEGILRRWYVAPNLSDEPRDAIVCAKVK